MYYFLYHSNTESTYTFLSEENSSNQTLLPADSQLIWKTEAPSWEVANLRKHIFLGWEPYKPLYFSPEELLRYLPTHKHDIENFYLLRNIGYPKNKIAIAGLFDWVKDINWPVAMEIAPYLASLGTQVKEEIERIMETEDSVWKYWVILRVIGEMNATEKIEFKYLLEKQGKRLTVEDKKEELDLAIEEVLSQLQG